MLEGLATWFLNNYLGKYLQNLNTDQLSIALLSGQVELENVPLRSDALRFFNSSLEVRSGLVGKISLRIPVSRIRSERWSISLEQVYIVTGPQRFETFDPTQDDQLNQELKLSALDGIEAEWRVQHDHQRTGGNYYPSYSSWMSYGTSFIGNIVENLQIQIRDVHIRYEDDISCPERPFACGFNLTSLSAQACDENGVPKFVHRDPTSAMAFKLVELNGMSAYLTRTPDLYGNLSPEAMKEKMSFNPNSKHEFILNPVSAQAKLKRDCSERPLNSRKRPRVVCDLELESIPLEITDEQYQCLITGGRSLHQLHKNRLYWKWRPREPVHDHARIWWRYAIACHMERIRERNHTSQWSTVLEKAAENVLYVEAFKSYLVNPVSLSAELKAVKDEQDEKRSFEELKALRDLAVFQLKQLTGGLDERRGSKDDHFFVDDDSPEEPIAQAPSLLQQYFPSWYSSSEADPEITEKVDESIRSPTAMSLDTSISPLEEEFIEGLADDIHIVPYKDLIFAQINFVLKRGSFKLYSKRKIYEPLPRQDDKGNLLFELEFNNVKLNCETRPRTRSYKFVLSLGAMYLRDMITKESVFPLLISPLNEEGAPLNSRASSSYHRNFAGISKSIQNFLPMASSKPTEETPLFLFHYETRPFGTKKVDGKLHISSQPLNIVYNPAVLHCLSEFFKIPDELNRSAQLSAKLRSVAYHRIEEAKQKTKEEFLKSLHSILDGHNSVRRNWDILCELSAPQIIIPEHFVNKDALLMVIDLGKFHFSNTKETQSEMNTKNAEDPTKVNEDDDDADDEEFCTPASSPGSPLPSTKTSTNPDFAKLDPNLMESTVIDKMYDRFTMSMEGMQVIIGRVKDNWRNAHLKGSSSLHVLDKFSISLLIEIRVVPTNDPQWPSIVISGTLPKLNVHVNEEKIQSLERMTRLLILGDAEREEASKVSAACQTDDLLNTPMSSPIEDEEIGNLFSDWNSKTSDVNSAAKLLLIQFCVSDMAVELQSQGRSIVELQVTGVKACLVKRPFDINMTLSVMSLLLVDALQTFGPNFELLVASHRHVMVDSLSGSLRGSEPVSPMSPVSPDPQYRSLEDSALDINRKLSSLQSRGKRATSPPVKYPHSPRHVTSPPSFTSPHSSRRQMHYSPSVLGLESSNADSEALITVDVLIISPNCPTIEPDESGNRERHQIVSIQFNSLDVIANQETIIELLAFFKRISPSVVRPSRNRRKVPMSDHACQTEGSVNRFGSLTCLDSTNPSKSAAISAFSTPNIFQDDNETHTSSKIKTRLDLRADFQRLNILLLRAKTGKMIGTFLLTEANIHSTVSKAVNVTGSLGGLQVMNLLSGSTLHQKIVSVGKDPMIEDKNCPIQARRYALGEGNEEKEALTFSISQRTDCTSAFQSYLGTPLKESTSFQNMNSISSDRLNIDLNIKMAAVCYIHTASFLNELNSCATDFKQYISNLAHSIRLAATEIALGIVHRRSEAINHQATMDEYYGTLPRAKGASLRSHDYDYPSLERGTRITAPAPTPRHESKTTQDFDLHLDVIMESPVLVIPRHERSFEVLVAHLGEISISNQIIQGYALQDEMGLPHDTQRVDRVEVTVTDMSLHSLNLIEKYAKYADDSLNLLSQFRHLLAQELYSCKSKGALPIWHDTAIDLRVDRIERMSSKIPESDSFHSFQFHGSEHFTESGFGPSSASENVFQVKGKVTNPLKLSLYRSQYELLQDGVKNMAPPDQYSDPEDLNDSDIARKRSFNNGLDPPSGSSEDPTEIEASFEVPQLILELRGDLVNSDSEGDTLVRLKFQDFAVFYDKTELYKNTIEIALKSVLMEDLQLDEGSKHRFLMSSSFKDQQHSNPRYLSRPNCGLSTSCPEFWFHNDSQHRGTSLPDNLDPKEVFGAGKPQPKQRNRQQSRNRQAVTNNHPQTPPPSAVSSRNSPIFNDSIKRDLQNEDNLIHIKVLNIDKRGPDYYKKYKCTNRFVDVNFNTLDIMFNLQTWVLVLDFFGIGAGPSKDMSSAPITQKAQDYERSKRTRDANVLQEDDFNMEIDIKVKHLSLILNKPEYEVASAGVRNFVSLVSLRDGNYSVGGKLGQFSLKDLTPHSSQYKDRFLSRGEQVLTFHFFKYTQDDEKLSRPYDASLKLRMASVIYVHTHRFYSEILVFFNQFHVLQSVTNSMRDVAAGGAVKDLAGRGTRIRLDIEAKSPLILLPMSASSSKILSVDLGFLEIQNTFKLSGDEGTISRESLASCSTNEVLGRQSRGTSKASRSTARSPESSGGRSMNSPSRRRRPSSRQRWKGEESSAHVTPKKCLLDVMKVNMREATLRTAERLSAFTDDDALAKDDILVGSFIVRPQSKLLLKETFELKLQVERNLDKAFNHRVPDTSVKGTLSKLHFAVDLDQYTMIRGLLAYNLGEPLDDLNFETAASEQTHPLSGQTWTGMFMEFDLQDVILDLLQHHENPSRNVQESGLARVNFIQSRLIFEGSSDSTTDVDLVSQNILLRDLRFVDFPANKKSNVFSKILLPMEVAERKSPMQAEVHFRATPNFNQFTILLNNMRLMCIFDWWISVLDFISKSTQNPSILVAENDPEPTEATTTKSRQTMTKCPNQEPLYPTAGVISRRAPIVESSGPVFELKLNITESEMIIVADASQSDTSTVILRSTTVVAFRPDMVERPFSCNLNNAEVFSCILGRMEESSLSIIDPVTINLDIGARNSGPGTSKGLADLTGNNGDERTAEVQLQQINIRLSYNDWLMFTAIMDSFPKQAREAIYGMQESRKKGSFNDESTELSDEPINVQLQINQLTNLGFRREDCAAALRVNEGQMDRAALWLTENAAPDPESQPNIPTRSSTEPLNAISSYFDGTPISFGSFELKASSVNICIIDDCKDADVPLLETTLRQLHLSHSFAGNGMASAQVSGSYYNRALSAWEPFLEPWLAKLKWELKKVGRNGQKLAMHMTTGDTINFNLTSTLVDLYQVVKENWTEDLQKANSRLDELKTRGPASRHRMAFVPYALVNNTGSILWFCTEARNTGTQFGAHQSRVSRGYDPNWVQVEPGETAQFTFENRGKSRHTHTHDVKIHQVIIKVHGWKEISPVSVDRVGTFFRKANPIPAADSDADLPPARIVCDVSLEGSARKLITVRSALQVTNALPHPMDLKLETSLLKVNDVREIQLQPGETQPIPLSYVWSRIYAKPSTGNVSQWKYCDEPVNWFRIMTRQDNSLEIRTSSKVWRNASEKYRFCVAIERENYPIEYTLRRTSEERIAPSASSWIQPAHKISLVSPIIVVNLLPCHLMLEYTVGYRTNDKPKINIAPGKESFLPVDISEQTVLHLSMDQYPKGSDLILPPNSGNFEARIKFTDQHERPLFLQVRVTTVYHGAVKISVHAPIWLVNKTGLPLVFKQEGSSGEAAGQDDEHEVGRMGAPLMFSFLEREGNHAIMMRVGKGLHTQGKTTWCKHFYIQHGARVRRLRVIPPDLRAEWVYIIGIEVRLGKGRYRDTFIVTLAPRFQVHNQTRHTVLLAQKCYATTFKDLEARATHLEAMPNATLSFHWPRLDMEQLLCIKLIDIEGGQWSGGFVIEGVSSFHVSIRDTKSQCVFIRVEIGLIGATYSIIFADSGNFPPPFRIDNFSEVPITYYQSGVQEEVMHQCAKPRHSLPYAWDEPTLQPHLTIVPPGGVSSTFNMNLIGEASQITYENFIYIVMSGTFKNSSSNPISKSVDDVESMELVLDVEGTKVILAKKEAGKRSQLWRMTSKGLLQHEGSSAPQDPKKSPEASMRNILVLDIGGQAVQPKHCVPLMLRKPDERRQLTQHWRFTEDGRMMCDHHGLFVQAQDGFPGLRQGNNVVLGPPSSVCYLQNTNGIPLEQAIDRHRLRPGSGFLSVKVTTDGPTRVLEITDVKQKRVYAQLEERDWHQIQQDKRPTMVVPGSLLPRKDSRPEGSRGREFQLVIEAKHGVGLSLVCRNPSEELLYVFMTNVVVNYQSSAIQTVLDGSVQHIQIDNQMHNAQIPIVLYLSPMNKNDDHRHMPAIHFTSDKSASKTENAVIYKHLMVTVKNMTINLEEELLCRVLKFAGITRSDLEMERMDESASEAQRALIASTTSATRYYFGILKLTLNQVKLSVIKSNKLAPDLQAVKRKLGLSLITFEDANIELDPFVLVHPFETINFLTNCVIKHYQDELVSQAVLILGSTDFLGNPLGFINDLTEGVSGLVSDGNVTGLIRNVAHGAANSAAKVTGTLSSGLSRVTLEERYDERRLMIRRNKGERGKEHLMAGLKGLGFGMLGGLTSVVTETYDGVANDGITGLFTGLGWGLIGTISKPAIGVLDLATGAASAVRESSKSSLKQLPPKVRPARVVVGPGGSMPVYSASDSQGQELMYRLCLNGRDNNETYVAHQILTPGDDDLQIMITSDRVIVFSCPGNSRDAKQLLVVSLSELVHARAVVQSKDNHEVHYIEMVISNQPIDPNESMSSEPDELKRPQVRCDNGKVATTVSQKINYAKVMFQERIQAVIEDVDLEDQ